jgi:hypothetical protein
VIFSKITHLISLRGAHYCSNNYCCVLWLWWSHLKPPAVIAKSRTLLSSSETLRHSLKWSRTRRSSLQKLTRQDVSSALAGCCSGPHPPNNRLKSSVTLISCSDGKSTRYWVQGSHGLCCPLLRHWDIHWSGVEQEGHHYRSSKQKMCHLHFIVFKPYH